MKKIRILAIAPYEGLKDLINEVSQENDLLKVTSYIADMKEGALLAKEMQHKGYDIILSRAGTAQLIRQVSELPVIDIKLSILDMMRAIKLAQGYSGKFAIVGYKTITKIAYQICELLQYNIQIKTVSETEEINDILLDLRTDGVGLIVGDVITNTHAKQLGLNSILITTGAESIKNAFEEAEILFNSIKKTNFKSEILKSILNHTSSSIVCFNENDSVIYSDFKDNITGLNEIMEDLKILKNQLLDKSHVKILKKYSHESYLIKGYLLQIEKKKYYTYYIDKPFNTVKLFDEAVKFCNVDDYPLISAISFKSDCNIFKDAVDKALNYAKLRSPILIVGEKGVGKDTFAHTIHQNSANSKNPLIILDAKYISREKWNEFCNSESSPFLNSEFTIYIKNIQLIDKDSQNTLESYFGSTDIHKRNKLIFSTTSSSTEYSDERPLIYYIKNAMQTMQINVPNLNQRRDDIPNMVSLYLHQINLQYGKNVVGFTKEALALLKEFEWSENIDQLKRIIRESVVLASSAYINEETMKKILTDESNRKPVSTIQEIDLSKTLEDINKDIIDFVMKDENYNLTNVAKRLGISRSTLWRKFK
ncbi:sigma-54-dependent Fis family transcriptional regulator [Alkalibacter mobilis]|uniref:sigma-54-dependent Fis family transcriptional regulator n=1 Tax=Alkalibacter mobilis TaxID=2787712 RepID=UPI00189CA041|nr:sigma-54-dependent transcriptional regulator [Alkalibacter mobilis]MBF7095637.1 PrpR N-terminal domain-containing protein [Alkalibacter mobilis]